MPKNGSDSQPPPENVKPQPVAVNIPPTQLKPNKEVSVPKYDLLTEGYDPAKLKKR